jgi:hypothetical protein
VPESSAQILLIPSVSAGFQISQHSDARKLQALPLTLSLSFFNTQAMSLRSLLTFFSRFDLRFD